MTAPRRTMPRTFAVGALLVAAGLACWALYVKQSASEQHSYSRGARPPDYVQLAAGHTYRIAIHGGVHRESALGVDPSNPQCTAAVRGQNPGALSVTPEDQGTKATDQIATFVSRITGDVQVRCTDLGIVYVDNAQDASFDWSGTWLVLASLALVIGIPLILSALRATTVAPAGGEPVDSELPGND